MDEATSNIDGQTDERIQTMLKDKFSDCTVLTIAHRIDTILWCVAADARTPTGAHNLAYHHHDHHHHDHHHHHHQVRPCPCA